MNILSVTQKLFRNHLLTTIEHSLLFLARYELVGCPQYNIMLLTFLACLVVLSLSDDHSVLGNPIGNGNDVTDSTASSSRQRESTPSYMMTQDRKFKKYEKERPSMFQVDEDQSGGDSNSGTSTIVAIVTGVGGMFVIGLVAAVLLVISRRRTFSPLQSGSGTHCPEIKSQTELKDQIQSEPIAAKIISLNNTIVQASESNEESDNALWANTRSECVVSAPSESYGGMSYSMASHDESETVGREKPPLPPSNYVHRKDPEYFLDYSDRDHTLPPRSGFKNTKQTLKKNNTQKQNQ